MKKNFITVCALLALTEGFDVKDGIVQITEDQMQKLEDHVKQLKDQVTDLTTEKQNLSKQVTDLTTEKQNLSKQVTDLTTEKQNLTQQVADLRKQPGADPDSHVDTHDDGEAVDFRALASAMADI